MNKAKMCEFCDGKIRNLYALARFSYKGETICISNVPAWVCAKCGEQYFDALVYKYLEGIAKHRANIKKEV